MILITGACGFISSALTWELNHDGINNIILCGELKTKNKWLNIRDRDYYDWINKNDLFSWLSIEENAKKIKAVVHLGACSATTENDMEFLMKNNYEYSKTLWNFCTKRDINYIYASSAATYGLGEHGYDDNMTPEELKKLQPLNKYGYSKKFFDDWALKQSETPKQWVGIKFFNVYGPQEYHKGRMGSMVYHSFHQYQKNKNVKLFKSHKDAYVDGGQLRDFVYIKDVVKILKFFINSEGKSGIYNIGTGVARSFRDLALNTVMASTGNYDLKEESVIKYIPMPEDLRGKYQYYTCAKMEKLKNAGYSEPFYSLEDGVKDYVQNYLSKSNPYLKN